MAKVLTVFDPKYNPTEKEFSNIYPECPYAFPHADRIDPEYLESARCKHPARDKSTLLIFCENINLFDKCPMDRED